MPPTDWIDPQNIIAVGTVIIAIFAFFVSCYSIRLTKKTLEQQQKHDRLSVKPIGIFELFDANDEIKIFLHNQGTGPMVIKSFEMFNESGEKEKNTQGDFKNYPIEWLDKEVRQNVEFSNHLENTALINGLEPRKLLYFKLDHTKPDQIDQRDHIRRNLKNLRIKMTYTDIYQELEGVSGGSLEYFGRQRFDP